MLPDSAQNLIVGLILFKILEFIVQMGLKKLTRDDYVTKKACEDCSSKDSASMSRLTSEIAIIKGILLVIAVKGEVSPEDLAKLTQYTG